MGFMRHLAARAWARAFIAKVTAAPETKEPLAWKRSLLQFQSSSRLGFEQVGIAGCSVAMMFGWRTSSTGATSDASKKPSNTSEDLRTQLKTQGASPAETHESRFFTDPPKQLHSHTVHRQRLQATETCSNVAILTGVASRSIASVPALSCRLHNRVVVAAHGQQNVAWLAWAAARKRYIPRTVTPELQHMCTVLRLCVCVCVCVCLCMTGVRACFLVRSSGPRVGVFASS